ncbi:iron-containing alcohol dehydrogenase family protein [Secundilactobacillus mixtipabuli]|uniref:Glycerol dehydrogenase n=1 Tax=Secundilactobacillus mixtipabuli TaxID=1435342 RepID=A0A1Z5IES1_9LACO|nr:iron-containing alcohol dehydrogenase family protein [Secundilactobacillus mixtipabuli]GAX00092.1 glycerol dehydrogenase [Secundilactobacillus mixtipabuli]
MISQSGPQRYISDNKAYDELPGFMAKLKVRTVLFLHGEKSLAAAQPYLPEWPDDVKVVDVPFGGECSFEEIDRVSQIADENNVDMVIGLGGGKVLDTSKSVTTGTHRYLVLIPTLASNCSPWSAISVHYKETGEHINHNIYLETANLMLLNPKVILNSPIEYFVAGIGDTLAKFYESELIFQQLPEDQYTVALTISRQMANNCKEVLLKNSIGAVEDMKAGRLTPRWRQIAETITVMAGTVGGWGDDYGRASGAHAIHDALTIFPATAPHLHGAKVAYGILVLLAIEGKTDNIRDLLPFYHELGLPTNLEDLNLGDIPDSDIEKIATAAADPSTQMHFVPTKEPVTAEVVKDAILTVEDITAFVEE